MSYLCFLGAAALSGAVIYREWTRRHTHQTIGELICALEEPVDLLNPDPHVALKNAKAWEAWTFCPAETIPAEELDELLLSRKLAQDAKVTAMKLVALSYVTVVSEHRNLRYIGQLAAEYKSLKDQATHLVSIVSPKCTLQLKQVL
jgi:hypothetical protein